MNGLTIEEINKFLDSVNANFTLEQKRFLLPLILSLTDIEYKKLKLNVERIKKEYGFS